MDTDMKPTPKMITKNGKPFVTDGYVGNSKFIVMNQPSEKTVMYLNQLYLDTYLASLEED
ncbi:hypothetical protein [Clostridium sp. UBA7339]|uniref:hypothetical protein n=1 Tax=Clostridium sp. UBA7339 TaxID=1946376 RepID=UPI003216A5F4